MGSYKGVISRVTILITHIRRLITPLITSHEPPSDQEVSDAGAKKKQAGFSKRRPRPPGGAIKSRSLNGGSHKVPLVA